MTKTIFAIAITAAAVVAAEKPIKLENTPASVQKAVQGEKAKGAEIKGLSTETEDGKRVYEIETLLNGRTRDLLIDGSGTIVEVEEQAELDNIPAPARAALQKRAVGGKITKLETVTKGNMVKYEAAITTKTGKKIEAAVNADGSPSK